MPAELLKRVFWHELENHADGKVCLLWLVAFVDHVGQIHVNFANMGEPDVLGTQKGCQARVVGRADVEGDVVVQRADGNLVELLAGETDILEVGGTGDLGCG